ncbi:YqaE/Pmp3 family membrane protein [Vreelandella sp. EE22]
MDAREYMSRNGVGIDRDPDRPNTLEEKAWARARGAGGERPKSGTPYDWEDWERYHSDLAEDAETLEQKIDKEAHRKAVERERREALVQKEPAVHDAPRATPGQEPVGHFDPASASTTQGLPEAALTPGQNAKAVPTEIEAAEPAGLKAAYVALAVLLPPLGVGLTGAGGKRVALALLLTLLGWLPGVVYALNWVLSRKPSS